VTATKQQVAAAAAAPPFLNRELSQLDLIRRVLDLAADPAEPLLERVKFCGIVLIVIAIVYWVEPAKSLPGFFPGHEAGSGHHHVKHGIASFLVGVACLVFAWFRTGPKRTTVS